jgi:hypothetical protein
MLVLRGNFGVSTAGSNACMSTLNTTSNYRMPTWFVPHGGGPCFFMDWNPIDAWDRMAHYLKTAASTLPRQPKAIVLVSAHWLEPHMAVTSGAHPELIYDYHGFPPHTYELKYPAPGAPALAARIVDLLQAQGIPAQQDDKRGFDHGVFIPMKLMFLMRIFLLFNCPCIARWIPNTTSTQVVPCKPCAMKTFSSLAAA